MHITYFAPKHFLVLYEESSVNKKLQIWRSLVNALLTAPKLIIINSEQETRSFHVSEDFSTLKVF
jgi:hypothetical protein